MDGVVIKNKEIIKEVSFKMFFHSNFDRLIQYEYLFNKGEYYNELYIKKLYPNYIYRKMDSLCLLSLAVNKKNIKEVEKLINFQLVPPVDKEYIGNLFDYYIPNEITKRKILDIILGDPRLDLNKIDFILGSWNQNFVFLCSYYEIDVDWYSSGICEDSEE